jgi:type IV pilus assembly protein PilB
MNSLGFVGDLLLRNGVVDAAGLTRAMETQAADKATLGRALANLGLAEESVVAFTIAAALHLEYLDGEPPAVAAEVAALLKAESCRKRGIVPLTLDGNCLRVAVSDPMDDSVLQDARFRTGRNIRPVVVTQTWLDELCARVYPGAERAVPTYDMLPSKTPSGEVETSTDGDYYGLVDPADTAKSTNLPPIIRLVNLILSDAAAAGASDIHIEPQEGSVQVRQRVDGLLRDVMTLPHNLQDQTISRLKIISGMDIAERRKPQDGRSRLRYEGRRIDLRVSTLPTQFGEKVVIRLLNSDRAILPLDQIDFSSENLRIMRSFMSRPQGMILVTGPTGSGKTSTLYTALNSIKSSSNNIVTLEDPIEFQLPGVNQMQINARAGVTFASGLRSILRQDPNVILVGEIRDQETAEIALQASQTGHLLLSTVHTNDAPATITRLFDLGIPPFLVASSLIGILAQRLVRRPCPSCVTRAWPSEAAIEKAGGLSKLPADGRWVSAKGCEKCAQSGVKGRLAIHEVLEINDEVRDLIAKQASEQSIRAAGKRGGMQTLFEDGLAKAAQGFTTLDELLRVVSPDEPVETAGNTPSAVETKVAPVAPAPAVVSATATANVSQAAEVGDPGQGPVRGRVLVVEDSPTIASVVKYFLELEGFDVLLAADGLAGLETAQREHPQVIVSDVNMPGMGGVAMVKALRADPSHADVRILMLTSEASIEAESEGLAAGADDYLLKPVEPRRLAARVKALLARSGSRAA